MRNATSILRGMLAMLLTVWSPAWCHCMLLAAIGNAAMGETAWSCSDVASCDCHCTCCAAEECPPPVYPGSEGCDCCDATILPAPTKLAIVDWSPDELPEWPCAPVRGPSRLTGIGPWRPDDVADRDRSRDTLQRRRALFLI